MKHFFPAEAPAAELAAKVPHTFGTIQVLAYYGRIRDAKKRLGTAGSPSKCTERAIQYVAYRYQDCVKSSTAGAAHCRGNFPHYQSRLETDMPQMNSTMQQCIDECLNCHSVCLRTAMSHCLEAGGEHVEPQHFRLMISCAEMCKTAADFMLIESPLHKRTCAVCAEVCDACARSCEQAGDMDECSSTCRRCAESCRRMAA